MDPESNEAPEDRAKLGRFWSTEIRAAEGRERTWRDRGDKIIKRYLDKDRSKRSEARRFNILHSNVQTILPSVYGQTPKPSVKRRFNDQDSVARDAAQVLERALSGCAELYDIDPIIERAVLDRLLPGRGQIWTVYEPYMADDGMGGEIKVDEKVYLAHVHWKDYLQSPGRDESEIWWKARRIYLTRQEMVAEFGKEVAYSVKLDHSPEGEKHSKETEEQVKKAAVWEVWDKRSGMVLHVAPASEESGLLKQQPAPLKLEGFFPCPPALLGTSAGDDLIPTPDYVIYQDQADELDELTERIGLLQKAIAVRGLYNSSSMAVGRLLSETAKNEMIAVDQWAIFKEGGGTQGNVEWLPFDQVAQALVALEQLRDKRKADLYEISGIADVMRGSSDAGETATAQQIKANWGSKRVRRLQKDVQRFVRDCFRLKAEVMAEMFEPQTLFALAGMMNTQPEQQAAVAQLLRDQRARLYRIEIETDSTIEPDEQEEKAAAVEFTTAVTGFLKEAGAIAGGSPAMRKLMGDLLMFSVRRFPKATGLEESIESAMKGLEEEAMQAAQQPPPPDPKVEAERAKLEFERERMGMDLEFKREEMGMKREELAMKREDMQTRQVMDRERMAQDADLKREDIAARAKPAANVNIDANNVMQQAAESLQAMAAQNGEALTVALQSVAQAVDKLGTSAEVMAQAAAEMGRPKRTTKRIVRGADGRAEGIEELVA